MARLNACDLYIQTHIEYAEELHNTNDLVKFFYSKHRITCFSFLETNSFAIATHPHEN